MRKSSCQVTLILLINTSPPTERVQLLKPLNEIELYIVSYISKAQKGMSELLRKTCDEARENNSTIKQQVRHWKHIS